MKRLRILTGEEWNKYGAYTGTIVVIKDCVISSPMRYQSYGTEGDIWTSIKMEVYEPQVS